MSTSTAVCAWCDSQLDAHIPEMGGELCAACEAEEQDWIEEEAEERRREDARERRAMI